MFSTVTPLMFSLFGFFRLGSSPLGLSLIGLFLYFSRYRRDAHLPQQLFHCREAFDDLSKAWAFFGSPLSSLRKRSGNRLGCHRLSRFHLPTQPRLCSRSDPKVKGACLVGLSFSRARAPPASRSRLSYMYLVRLCSQKKSLAAARKFESQPGHNAARLELCYFF